MASGVLRRARRRLPHPGGVVAATRTGQTNGKGYIGLAAMIFGNWRPGGCSPVSLLFGYTEGARLRSGGESVHALLLIVVVGAARRRGLAVPQAAVGLWRPSRRRSSASRACAGTSRPTRSPATSPR